MGILKRFLDWWNYCPVCADIGFCNQHPGKPLPMVGLYGLLTDEQKENIGKE